MSPQNLPDFDSLWDYSHPDQTEIKFRKVLLQIPENDPAYLELLTQIARTQGLQRKFDEAHQTLDQVEKALDENPSRAKVRYLLERGRVFNSSGHADEARPFFEQALDLAKRAWRGFLCSGCDPHAGDHRSEPASSPDLEPAEPFNWQNLRDRKKRATGSARCTTIRVGHITIWANMNQR